MLGNVAVADGGGGMTTVTGTWGGEPASIDIAGASCEHIDPGHHAVCSMRLPAGDVVQCRIPVPEHMTDQQADDMFSARAAQMLGVSTPAVA